MWHNYRALNKLSLGLILVSLIFLAYAFFKVSFNSKLFMVERINFVGDINHVSRDQFSSVVTKNFFSVHSNLFLIPILSDK